MMQDNDRGATQHFIGRECGLSIEVLFVRRLAGKLFTCEVRFVDEQRVRLTELTVGRHLIATLEVDVIA